MKTNKFENTIRQKLESIEPDFHEADWTKMQNFMQVHTPPTLWQQYGSWLGYAAAASVSTVMAFMYVNQLSQTKNLVSDVKKLQSQIEVIKNAPAQVAKTDTVYILRQELAKDQFGERETRNAVASTDNKLNIFNDLNASKKKSDANSAIDPGKSEPDALINNTLVADKIENEDKSISSELGNKKDDVTNNKIAGKKAAENYVNPQLSESLKSDLSKNKSVQNYASNQSVGSNKEVVSNYNQTKSPVNNNSSIVESNGGTPTVTPTSGKALDESFNQIAEAKASQPENNSRRMNYALDNRLSGREVKKVLLASAPAIPLIPAKTVEDKKIEQVAKADNVIPKLNIKVPYRFGAGIQFEGKNQVKTVLGEVLVSKKFSISAGVSWLKIKPMEFLSEKIFRVKNGQDFKKSHPNQVPKALEIMNISIRPSLVQIPLTVAFRNDLKDNFSYFVSAGTNVTVKGREQFSFDCRLPSTYPNPHQEIFSQAFERKMDIPVINSVNFSAGIEKTWHPIVFQVEGYVYNYFKPISGDNHRTGPGVKVKLLYQIGGKM